MEAAVEIFMTSLESKKVCDVICKLISFIYSNVLDTKIIKLASYQYHQWDRAPTINGAGESMM